MRTIIIGAGAIGGTVAARLAHAGQDAAVVDPWPDHVAAIAADGIRLVGALGETTSRLAAVTNDRAAELGRADLVLIATKSYDTRAAAELALGLIDGDGIVASMQNGMNDRVVAEVVGADRALGIVVNIGGKLLGPGAVECSGALSPAFEVGALSGEVDDRVEAVAELLDQVAPAIPTANLLGRRWAKLTHNSMFNALAGLTGTGNPPTAGYVPNQIAVNIAAEAIAVARATGTEVAMILGVPADDYVAAASGTRVQEVHAELLRGASALPADVRPSLLQDIEKGRKTEIDELNGYIVAAGRDAGVPTPFNERIVSALRDMVAEGRSPDAANMAVFDDLLAMQHAGGTRP